MNNYKKFDKSEPVAQGIWIPIFIGILLMTLVGILWISLREQDRHENQMRIEAESIKLLSYIEADMDSRIPSLERLVNRWEFHKGTSKEEFIYDANAYVNDLPGFQAIEWVDNTFHVRWIVPLAGNEQARNLNLALEDQRRIALENAKDRHKPTMTSPIDLVQGGKGFLIYLPIYIDGKFDGFLLAVFRIDQWLDHVFSENEDRSDKENFVVSVSIDDLSVFEQTGFKSINESSIDVISNTPILDHKFTVYCKPTPVYLKNNSTNIPELTALVGFLLSILVSVVIYLSQKSSIDAWRNHVIKTKLEVEISNHNKTENELFTTNSRLILATKAGNFGIWEWNIITGKLTWNDIMYELYNVPVDVIPNYDTWKNSVHPEDINEVEELLEKALKGTASFDTEFRIVRTDGKIFYIRTAGRVERGDNGKPLLMTGVNWNITKRKQAEDLLVIERRRLADILEGTNVGTWEWNVQTGETVFNERWAEILGYTLKEISPTNIDTWTNLANSDDLKRSGELLEKHFNKEIPYYECEARMKHKSGHWVWVLDRGKVATWTDDGKPLLMSGTHAEITGRKQNEEKILHMASHDALTDLPSLKLAQDRIRMAISQARRNKNHSAVLFVDLDGFKQVNDTFGHDAGDYILKEVSSRLCACVRDTDTVARIGGDEFLLVLTELQTSENASHIAEKIIEHISQSFSFNGKVLSVGSSIGISLFPDNGEDVETLIKEADNAMYKVKKSGKNNYTFA
jgi:diguanylate cyclase (GGDEF)-like protein/PAS domain S-box-containing protein